MVTPRRDPRDIRRDLHRRLTLGALAGPVKLLSFDEILDRIRKTNRNVKQLELALILEEQMDRGVVEREEYRGLPHYRLRDPSLGPPIHTSLAGEPGTPFAAFRRAEVLYLERSGWTLNQRGRWSHPLNPRQGFYTEHALLHQIHADESLLVRRRLGLPVHSRPLSARAQKRG